MTERKTLARVFEVLVIKVGGTGLGFLVALLGSRYLGAEQVGLLIYGVGLANLLLPVFSLGLPQLMLRRAAISQNIVSFSPSLLKSVCITGLSAAVAFVLIYLGQDLLVAVTGKPGLGKLLPYLVTIFFCSLLISLLTWSLQGLGYVRFSAAIRPVFISIIICFAYFTTSPQTAIEQSGNLAWIHVVSVLGLLLVWAILFSWLQRGDGNVKDESLFDLREGRFFWYNSMVRLLSMQLPVIILGAMVPSAFFAYFVYASRYSRLAKMILVSMTNVISPKIAKSHAQGKHAELERLAKWSVKVSLCLAVPLIIAMLVFIEPLLAIFGDDFVQAAPVLRLMLIAEMINVACGPVGYLLSLTGHERITFRVNTVTGILAILACPLAISGFGIMGAALVLAVRLCVTNFAGTIFVQKELGFTPLKIWKREILD